MNLWQRVVLRLLVLLVETLVIPNDRITRAQWDRARAAVRDAEGVLKT